MDGPGSQAERPPRGSLTSRGPGRPTAGPHPITWERGDKRPRRHQHWTRQAAQPRQPRAPRPATGGATLPEAQTPPGSGGLRPAQPGVLSQGPPHPTPPAEGPKPSRHPPLPTAGAQGPAGPAHGDSRVVVCTPPEGASRGPPRVLAVTPCRPPEPHPATKPWGPLIGPPLP